MGAQQEWGRRRAGWRPSGRTATATAVVSALVVALLAACTQPAADPERAGTVVVAVDVPFGSLNGGTVAGRTPGSTLVRSLAQAGFVALDEDGAVVPDTSFGTVEKVSDDPLTVRYTLAETATWSDGVPVTPDDLLLEWAARSGQLDDVVPELGPDGAPDDPAVLEGAVAFAATSPVLAQAEQVPAVDGDTVTVTYATPVADWRTALDVGVPAHVVGRVALDEDDPQEAAAAVTAAITEDDRDALQRVSATWRTLWDADALVQDASAAVTTGPYAVSAVTADEVELVRNESYRGQAPAAFDRVVVRTDLHPLDAVAALRDDDVDVVAPTSTADVLDALADVPDAQVRTGGDAVLQAQLRVTGGGPFDPATYGDDAGTATQVRAAFLAVLAQAGVADLVTGLWPDATATDALLPESGPGAGEPRAGGRGADALPADVRGDGPVVVRVLAATADPVRAAALDAVRAAAQPAGFDVREAAGADDVAGALGDERAAWDVALVPVAQSELPVAAVAARWRSDGATNVTGWADDGTDAAVDALVATTDPADLDERLDAVASALAQGSAAASLVRLPVVTATRHTDPDAADRLPVVPVAGPLALGRADLTSWWSWAREGGTDAPDD